MTSLLTTDQAAELIGVSRDTLLSLIRSKEIKAVNVGAGKKLPRYRIEQTEVTRFIELRRIEQPKRSARRKSSDVGRHKYI